MISHSLDVIIQEYICDEFLFVFLYEYMLKFDMSKMLPTKIFICIKYIVIYFYRYIFIELMNVIPYISHTFQMNCGICILSTFKTNEWRVSSPYISNSCWPDVYSYMVYQCQCYWSLHTTYSV